MTDANSDCNDDQLGEIVTGMKSHGIELIIM